MRLVAFAAALAAAAGPALAQPRSPDPPRNWAVLIGINGGGNDPQAVSALSFAQADAIAFSQELRRTGRFDVTELLPPRADRRTIVRTLRDIALKADEKDTFLLFFAGHGVQSPLGGSHWVTQDTTLDSIEIDGIRLGHVIDYVQMIKAKNKLLILDHCFSGEIVLDPALTAPVAGAAAPVGAAAPPATPWLRSRHVRPREDGIERQLGSPRRSIVVLAASWDLAWERESTGHGYLTEKLLKAFRTDEADIVDNNVENDGLLTSTELVEYVQGLAPGAGDLEEVPQLPEAWHTGNELSWPLFDLSSTPEQVLASVARFRNVPRNLAERRLIDLNVQQRAYDAINSWQRQACPTRVANDEAGIARCQLGAGGESPPPRALDILHPADQEIVGLLSRLAGSRVAPERQAELLSALVANLERGLQ